MTRAIHHLRRCWTRLLRREDGNATTEFMIIVPVYLALMVMSLELSMITLRQTMLERGLDIAVRDIRLGTGEFTQTQDTQEEKDKAKADYHDKIKKRICDEALIISDCMNSVRLQMIRSNMRNLTTLGDDVQCTDKKETGNQVLDFSPGQQNDLMFLRACVKYDPLFPTGQLARSLTADDSGQLAIVSMSAFVMEPL
ncbi:TadE/TadG family type IV pilus assembly protein [Roseovarius sp. S4756]|uniref:TadE/TadG family type IV pilus assembly protein n=1 Tax=Roseovarius maritimus TaxID=3342637 RepID=UPI00372C9281